MRWKGLPRLLWFDLIGEVEREGEERVGLIGTDEDK